MPWAISSPFGSSSAVEKSMLCLTTNERAVRITVTAMPSAMPARAFLISSKTSGSRRVASAMSLNPIDHDVGSCVQRCAPPRWDDGGGVVFLDDEWSVAQSTSERLPRDDRRLSPSILGSEVGLTRRGLGTRVGDEAQAFRDARFRRETASDEAQAYDLYGLAVGAIPVRLLVLDGERFAKLRESRRRQCARRDRNRQLRVLARVAYVGEAIETCARGGVPFG